MPRTTIASLEREIRRLEQQVADLTDERDRARSDAQAAWDQEQSAADRITSARFADENIYLRALLEKAVSPIIITTAGELRDPPPMIHPGGSQ